MKSEFAKTLAFLLVAVALVVAAAKVAPVSHEATIFSDQGEPLFLQLRDVADVKAIEVIDYDETEAVARPLKVEFRRGRWILPSHNDYPAEARDRMAKTVGALVGLRKDLVVSDRVEDHSRYGVVDPLDQKVASLTGRGKRVTLRDEQGQILADLVQGNAVKEREGYRYLRLPGQKRTYAVKTEADPSARFEDWVESDLLKTTAAGIRKITIHSYSINETTGRLMNLERALLTREGNDWKLDGAERINNSAVQGLVGALAELRVIGVRPKPPSLAQELKSGQGLQMNLETVMSLRQRGYFISPDGRVLSKEGEIIVETDKSLVYTLRFGEVAAGSPSGSEEAPAAARGQNENRYLFVTVAPRKDAEGAPERLAKVLAAKFADWYYVISSADFSRLRLTRKDLAR